MSLGADSLGKIRPWYNHSHFKMQCKQYTMYIASCVVPKSDNDLLNDLGTMLFDITAVPLYKDITHEVYFGSGFALDSSQIANDHLVSPLATEHRAV